MRFLVHNRKGFTIIELLVVIAIIVVLVALLLPSIQKVRESANRVTCANNMRQIGTGLLEYHRTLKYLPPAVLIANGVSSPNSQYVDFGPNWAVLILPYIDQAPLYASVANSVNTYMTTGDPYWQTGAPPSWRSIANTRIPTYLCPSDAPQNSPYTQLPGIPWARGNYGVNAGPGMLWIGGQYGGPGFDTDGSIGTDASGNYITVTPLFPPGASLYEKTPNIPGGTVMGVNSKISIADDVVDGANHTIMVDELRIGPGPSDLRGVWAMGQGGAAFPAAMGEMMMPSPT